MIRSRIALSALGTVIMDRALTGDLRGAMPLRFRGEDACLSALEGRDTAKLLKAKAAATGKVVMPPPCEDMAALRARVHVLEDLLLVERIRIARWHAGEADLRHDAAGRLRHTQRVREDMIRRRMLDEVDDLVAGKLVLKP